ncbi:MULTISPECIES: hypothetical protein [unclassified Mesorhizobium]|uniref:hypothetical protein n=1 Tax=unclassified Mesorhizobium TaxID=325217 RepID=UPI0012EBC5A2|nr:MULTISPECIES: hypothetical protein [unclassified Mesorhizobium]WJI57290.1 hypothetical protein NLY33_00555 [Mesorhizobium sp. C432A]
MHPRTDLSLLLESLSQLSKTPYFNKALEAHTRALIDTVDHVLTVSPSYDDEIVRSFSEKAWITHRYLQGSTTKELPYEIEYCMRFAIADWLPEKCLVTTALTDEKDFHLKVGDPWEFVAKVLTRYEHPLPDSRLIFIGVPRLYKHMPLFCSALYHELGHFVDLTRNITETTMLLEPIEGASEVVQDVVRRHRCEHFADLFAACYVGSAIADSLNAVHPFGERTPTHPPTSERIEVIRGFLADESFDELTMFQDTLSRLGMPRLERRFVVPEIESAFDDIRPYTLTGEAELHGIIPAGWSYMAKALHGAGAPWTRGAQRLEIIRVINDLTEKSVRNSSLRQLWSSVSP